MDTIARYAMLIDGDWVDTEDRFEIRSPATEELVASVARGGREHADRAIAAAKAAHADGRWRLTPPTQRAAMLDAIADRLTERIGDLAVLEAQENGAPVRQAGAFQIGFSIAHLRYFADQARSYAFERTGPLLKVPTQAGRPAVRAGLLGRADDLHRRPQRHDDRPRGDLRSGPRGDPRREHGGGDPDRQRHRIRAVRRGLEHRQPAGARRGGPARGGH